MGAGWGGGGLQSSGAHWGWRPAHVATRTCRTPFASEASLHNPGRRSVCPTRPPPPPQGCQGGERTVMGRPTDPPARGPPPSPRQLVREPGRRSVGCLFVCCVVELSRGQGRVPVTGLDRIRRNSSTEDTECLGRAVKRPGVGLHSCWRDAEASAGLTALTLVRCLYALTRVIAT